jgi:hypothetical protein
MQTFYLPENTIKTKEGFDSVIKQNAKPSLQQTDYCLN